MTYEEHRARANALIKGHTKRHVSAEAWDEAEEHICSMFAKAATPDEEQKAVEAMDKLGSMNELWRARQQPRLMEA